MEGKLFFTFYRISKKWNFLDFFMNFGPENLSKDDLYRGNLMRRTDCAHSRSVKTLPWPWFRVEIEAKMKKFGFWPDIRQVFLCEKSIARVFETWKCFLALDSWKGWDIFNWKRISEAVCFLSLLNHNLPLFIRSKSEFFSFSHQYATLNQG